MTAPRIASGRRAVRDSASAGVRSSPAPPKPTHPTPRFQAEERQPWIQPEFSSRTSVLPYPS